MKLNAVTTCRVKTATRLPKVIWTGRIATAGDRPIYNRSSTICARWYQYTRLFINNLLDPPTQSPTAAQSVHGFSHFCMADVEFLLYVILLDPLSPKFASLGDLNPSLIQGSLEPPDPSAYHPKQHHDEVSR